ncbi:MAG: hypothetical protein WBA22_11140 [Candidatus Methanofastidiosia archaeon]
MTSNVISSEENKPKKFLKSLLVSEIFSEEIESISPVRISSEIQTRFETAGILMKSSQTTLDDVRRSPKPWLKTRLFESIAIDVALEEYLNQLVEYEGENASAEVEVPGLLGALHILTSASPLLMEAIDQLEKRKKIKLSRKQKEVLRSILDPKKTYQIDKIEVSFCPYNLEDIRSEISGFLVDQMARRIPVFRRRKSLLSLDNMLEERIPMVSIRGFSQEQIIYLARELVIKGDLKLCILGVEIIWEYREKPPLLMTDETIFILPKANRRLGYSDNDAAKQANIVSDFLRNQCASRKETATALGLCIICNERMARKLAFHRAKTRIIPVCEECFNKERDIIAEIPLSLK